MKKEKTATVTEMQEALSKAGWVKTHTSVWRSPDGRYYRGPALAYYMMMGLPWPPKK